MLFGIKMVSKTQTIINIEHVIKWDLHWAMRMYTSHHTRSGGGQWVTGNKTIIYLSLVYGAYNQCVKLQFKPNRWTTRRALFDVWCQLKRIVCLHAWSWTSWTSWPRLTRGWIALKGDQLQTGLAPIFDRRVWIWRNRVATGSPVSQIFIVRL